METQHVDAGHKRKRGAPKGNRNAFKTGRYVTKNLQTTSEVAQMKRQVRTILRLVEAALRGEPA